MRKVAVASVADLPPGSRRRVVVDGRAIVIFCVGSEYYALRDTCPHRGARLSDGVVLCGALSSSAPGNYAYDPKQAIVKCPWHGWEFDLASGRSWVEPARTKVRAYPLEVESGGTIRHKMLSSTYAAETIPVVVEDNYLVLTLESERETAK